MTEAVHFIYSSPKDGVVIIKEAPGGGGVVQGASEGEGSVQGCALFQAGETQHLSSQHLCKEEGVVVIVVVS